MSAGAGKPLVYGHRGTRRGAPENSLRAFELALDQGADGVELDVRLCASGEVIVLHDRDLLRVAGSPLVAAQASFGELRAHDLGQGERVPSLVEALALVLGRGARMNIELKADVPDPVALVAAVGACVAGCSEQAQKRVLFSSFSPAICEMLCALGPSARVGFLFEDEAEARAQPPGICAVHPRHTLAQPVAVARFHAQGLCVNVWTVNLAERACELATAAVDAIITDDVPLVLAALASQNRGV